MKYLLLKCDTQKETLNYTHANHSFRLGFEVYTSSKAGPTGGVAPGEL